MEIRPALVLRNHGIRLVDGRVNGDWGPTHAADMYGVILGTAVDVVTLIDMIPARLGLTSDRIGMTGGSLGGHTTLMAMARDPRIRVGVPVIGGGEITAAGMQSAVLGRRPSLLPGWCEIEISSLPRSEACHSPGNVE